MSRHAMPWGAELRDDGKVRFGLWAPARETVGLVLPDQGRRLAMERREDGWFHLVTAAVPGERYLFDVGDGLLVADPASRGQAEDAVGPSLVVDPLAYRWRHPDWRGRPWHETVLLELHVGTFTPEGTFRAALERLPHLAETGITAVELMPVADFPGARGWGYDGVLPFAPDRAYGTPDELKALIDAAHGAGLQVFLDVVYNHFGPEGNWFGSYAPKLFTEEIGKTPWGASIDFRESQVRSFYVHNALYWLEEYRFDGLRLDAVHAIHDPTEVHILQEIARAVRDRFRGERHVHLVLENEKNQARFLGRGEPAGRDGAPPLYDAQWNDDLHHALHVLVTGERLGYYEDFAEGTLARLGRGLAQGFVYQGEPSAHAGGRARGEPSAHLPPTAFVDFLQNHDQIGNRALGERLAELVPDERLAAAHAILLLAPHVPMLFMGEEWAARTRFLYFCDFHGELAEAVRQGRRKEFAAFFADPAHAVPDPLAEETFLRSKLDWSEPERAPHKGWLAETRDLLRLRAERIVPLLPRIEGGAGAFRVLGGGGLEVGWRLADGRSLVLLANLADRPAAGVALPAGELLHATHAGLGAGSHGVDLPPWSVVWRLADG